MNVKLNLNPSDADDANPRIGMAPLVDIVLLLICFYLLVMQSMQSRADDQIELPRMANNQTSEVAPAELVINIDTSGQINLNGEQISLTSLGDYLLAERSRAEKAGDQINVVIRADGRQSYRPMRAALLACRDAGLPGAIIRATEGQP